MMICVDKKNMTSIAMLYVAMEHLCTNLKDWNRATIIYVRGKNEYFAEVVNAYGQTVAKRNIIDEEIK